MMIAPYTYRAFGLTIGADFCLPGLALATGEPDVVVTKGTVPQVLADATERIGRIQVCREHFLLNIPGVARYLVSYGKNIVVDAAAFVDHSDMTLFLLGSAFDALLKQRGHLVLHGSAVVINGETVIFSGVSGAGKSTLAAAFYKKGYKILTDDLCVIAFSSEGVPYVLPGYPRLKLWSDVAQKFGEDTSQLSRVRSQVDKFELPVQQGFESNSLPVRNMYCLIPTQCSNMVKMQLTGFEKIETLISNTYRFGLLKGMKQRPLHLQQCAAVAKAMAMYKINRPSDTFVVDEIVACIEQDIVGRTS